jgi:hypothetical protein
LIAIVVNTILLEAADFTARGGLLKLLFIRLSKSAWAVADITTTIELDGLRQKPIIRSSRE